MRETDLYSGGLSRLVARQLGHVTHAQLLEAGWTPSSVATFIARGVLIRVHKGVYAVGHLPRHANARACAAVLACGEGAALSHQAAAALWGVMDWPHRMEVTARRERRHPMIATHRSTTLTHKDIRRRHGVKVTSPTRTVLDLSPRLGDLHLQRLVNDLRVARHLNQTAFRDLCARNTKIANLLGDSERPTQSVPEDRFKAFLKRHRLPLPEFNVTLRGRELDALYPAHKLIIELDSWGYHGDRQAFGRDRRKDGRALADGYRTLRIATDQLDDETADSLRRALAQ